MIVIVRVCDDNGWHQMDAEVPNGSDKECYALHRSKSRLEFWQSKSMRFKDMPDGHALIWRSMDITDLEIV